MIEDLQQSLRESRAERERTRAAWEETTAAWEERRAAWERSWELIRYSTGDDKANKTDQETTAGRTSGVKTVFSRKTIFKPVGLQPGEQTNDRADSGKIQKHNSEGD